MTFKDVVSKYLPVIIFPAVGGVVGLTLLFLYVQSNYFPQIQIDWSTGSELDVVGYNILRSDTPEGDYIVLNQAIIAAEDPFSGGKYQYIDKTVAPGTMYYYWLEAISIDGSSERHGPIQANSKAFDLSILMIALLAIGCSVFLPIYCFVKKRGQNEASG